MPYEVYRLFSYKFVTGRVCQLGDRGSTVVKVLCTNRKVAGSIPDGVIEIFHWHNPSDRTMTLGSTQPLTEMSTRSIYWR